MVSTAERDDSAGPRRAYGGQSADVRRRQRRARLLDAAMDAMARNEWRTATVGKVCAAAGLNKRYFYESFADLDALAAAVVDDVAESVRTATVHAADSVTQDSVDALAFAAVAAACTHWSTTLAAPGSCWAVCPPRRNCTPTGRR
uniref:Transcriptional regulator, TetR family n=2 Tax=unclassified Mycobacterium TaxID=2642494 RepID=A0A5Q5BR17_MYCSS